MMGTVWYLAQRAVQWPSGGPHTSMEGCSHCLGSLQMRGKVWRFAQARNKVFYCLVFNLGTTLIGAQGFLLRICTQKSLLAVLWESNLGPLHSRQMLFPCAVTLAPE